MNWQSMLASPTAGVITGAVSSYITAALIDRQRARRAKELQETQNAISMGVTSHMAQILFDKHVEFCEEYIEAVSGVIPSSTAQRSRLDLLAAERLIEVLQKWAIWLSKDLDTDLEQIELALTVPGAWTFDPSGTQLSTADLVERLRRVLKIEELTNFRDDLIATSSTASRRSS